MENVNSILSKNILKYRKEKELSQEALAEQVGVTFQAVSKWETCKSAPDVTFLPKLADIFGCRIDDLFSREKTKEAVVEYCEQLPWEDDGILRGVVCEGKKILQRSALVDAFTFEVKGDAKQVQSECNITIEGNVVGGCKAGANITVKGCIDGGCHAGAAITVGGNISGGCNVGGMITCAGNLFGSVNCGNKMTVGGNVEAEKIKGSVVCNQLKCEKIAGNVTVQKSE